MPSKFNEKKKTYVKQNTHNQTNVTTNNVVAPLFWKCIANFLSQTLYNLKSYSMASNKLIWKVVCHLSTR